MKKFWYRVGVRLIHYSQYAWYGPLIGFLAGLDAYVFLISVEAILFPSVLAKPKKWLSTGLWLTLGSALGATSFSILTSKYGEGIIKHFFPHLLNSRSWNKMLHLIDVHGAWGLAVVSFSPLPQHAAVAIAGLGHMKPLTVFLAVLIGRGLKYIPLAWATTHTPRLLRKLHILPKKIIPPKTLG